MELADWFVHLWHDYAAIAPRVSAIRGLLEERGEQVVDDHVAFRTFANCAVALEPLGEVFESFGYQAFDNYEFPDKKLVARSWVHPDDWPRIFLSELLVDDLSPSAQQILTAVTAQLRSTLTVSPETFWAGRLWAPVRHEEYLALQDESEYAAWLVALGLRPNHFTVHVNALDSFNGLGSLLDFVAAQGYPLNEAGGRIKGTVEVGLEQGSTMADRLEVEFADGRFEIPTCYYEFALRHVRGAGLYDGFVTSSADRIFESTHAR